MRMKRRDFLKLSFAFLAGASAYSTLIEPNTLKLTRLELDLKLKESLKVFHLTDLHITKLGRKEREAIELVHKSEPDIVFITGDFVDYRLGIRQCSDFLMEISKSYKCYGVIGNHDIWASEKIEGALEQLAGIFEDNGVRMLRNEAEYLSKHGLYIAGVDDPFTEYLMNVDKALSMHDDKPRILLAHSPDVIFKAKGRADLILAGHTHGGQVRLPLLGALWVPAARKYAYGFFNEEKTMMYVSRGLGEIVPIRFNCPPEIVEAMIS